MSGSYAIALAQLVGRVFIVIMGETQEPESRWAKIGEVALWVIFYFCAVWLLDALLPPKPEQTPFEVYLKGQVQGQYKGSAPSDSDQQPDGDSAGQAHHSLRRSQ
jgi:hypothetical protein